VDKGHGRLEQRAYVCLAVMDWLDGVDAWQDLHGVVEVPRRVSNNGKETVTMAD